MQNPKRKDMLLIGIWQFFMLIYYYQFYYCLDICPVKHFPAERVNSHVMIIF